MAEFVRPSRPGLDLSFYRDWLARREEELRKNAARPVHFVTISREYGCEGYQLAVTLTEKLNARKGAAPWTMFTHDMIDEMLANENISKEMINHIAQGRWKFRDWFIDALVPKYLQSQSSQVFERMRDLVLNLVSRGNCVIVGTAGQILSGSLDPRKFRAAHVRVIAPQRWRVARLRRLYNLTEAEAEHTILSKQGLRDRFIADFTGMNANNPDLYHMIFNNARMPVDTMAGLVNEALRLNGAFED